LNAVIPISTVILVTILVYIFTGVNECRMSDELAYTAKDIFSNGNSWNALLYATVLGNVVAFTMALCQHKILSNGDKVRLATLSELFESFFEGVGVICRAMFGILCFAWCLNGIVKDMRLGDFMISSIGDSVDIRALPFISFMISGIISLFIGSSWATMAVMFPLVVPLALYVSEYNQDETIAVMGTILAGSVWGDHCSPISDTTILSSMACGCDHNDHVATQLPYAVFVAFFSAIFGDLCVGYMEFDHPYFLGIFIGILLMTAATYCMSSIVPLYKPSGDELTDGDFKYSKFYELGKSIWGSKQDDSMFRDKEFTKENEALEDTSNKSGINKL